jgi:hypothetical protein
MHGEEESMGGLDLEMIRAAKWFRKRFNSWLVKILFR